MDQQQLQLRDIVGVTVGRLRAVLAHLPDNLPVHFLYDREDFRHTMVAPGVIQATPAHVTLDRTIGKPVLTEEFHPDGESTAAIILSAVPLR